MLALLARLKPNVQQVKSGIRWGVTAFSGPLTLWLVQRGLTAEQAIGLLNNPDLQLALATGIAQLISLVWGLGVHTEKATAEAAEAMPNVQAVVTRATAAGEALARAVPSQNVVAANDPLMPGVVAPHA